MLPSETINQILPYDATENDANVGMLMDEDCGLSSFSYPTRKERLLAFDPFIHSWPLGFVFGGGENKCHARVGISFSSITVNKHVKHNNRNSNNMNDAHEPHGIIYFLFLRHFPTVMDEDPKGFVFSRVIR